MPGVPFSGRLDLPLACLLAIAHGGRALRRDEVSAQVLALVDHLDVEPDCLDDLDAFDEGVDRALRDLVRAKWVAATGDADEAAYAASDVTPEVVEWVRSRIGRDEHRAEALAELESALAASAPVPPAVPEAQTADDEDDADASAAAAARASRR